MCKLDVILNTDVRKYDEKPTATRGMTMERIRFNTDVMFYVAKLLKMPLDRTADLMRNNGAFSLLNKAFGNRHKSTTRDIANLITKSLVNA